ncbi:MAG: hypothetical protein FWH20_06975 [Oscillospiraceae bacterium]|nr:hypothetical protein [Oscillospiraceae bacterium]
MRKFISLFITVTMLAAITAIMPLTASAEDLAMPANPRWNENYQAIFDTHDTAEYANGHHIKLYKDDELIFQSGYGVDKGTMTVGINPYINESGVYYFEVAGVLHWQYLDSPYNVMSEFAASPIKTYTRPDTTLGHPTNLRWEQDDDTIYAAWDAPDDFSFLNGDTYQLELYRVGTTEFVGGGVSISDTRVTFRQGEGLDAPGDYYFRVRTLSGVLDDFANSEYSPNSPIFTLSDFPTPNGYSANDYQKLVAFAGQDDNLTKLDWDLEDPANWEGILWTSATPRRVATITLNRKNLTGELDLSEFSRLSALQISTNQLTKLNLENCTSLTNVQAGSNLLTEINLANCTSLEGANLAPNKLSAIDISACTKLTFIHLNNNELVSIDVSKNTEIETLNVFTNKLESLDVTTNTKLTQLSATNNKLESIDVTKNTLLTNLNLGFNQLSEIDVTKNTALKIFSIGNNQLESLDVSANIELVNLEVPGNQITALNLSNNSKLTSLQAYDNRLSALTLSNDNIIESVNVHNNKLTDTSFLKNLKSLYHFYIHHNEIDLRDPAIRRTLYTAKATVRRNFDMGEAVFCEQNNGVNCCDECVLVYDECVCDCIDAAPPAPPTDLADMRLFAAIALAFVGTFAGLWVYTIRRKRQFFKA